MEVESKIDKLLKKSLNMTKVALITAAVASISGCAGTHNSDVPPSSPQNKGVMENTSKDNPPSKKKEHYQYPHSEKNPYYHE